MLNISKIDEEIIVNYLKSEINKFEKYNINHKYIKKYFNNRNTINQIIKNLELFNCSVDDLEYNIKMLIDDLLIDRKAYFNDKNKSESVITSFLKFKNKI